MRKLTGSVLATVVFSAAVAAAALLTVGARAADVVPPEVTTPSLDLAPLPDVDLPQVDVPEVPSLQGIPSVPDAQAQLPDVRQLRPQAGTGEFRCSMTALNDLVANGTLTQEQAQAINDGVRSRVGYGMGRHDRGAKAEAIQQTLADLVSKGTITQAQADATKAAIDKAWSEGRFGRPANA